MKCNECNDTRIRTVECNNHDVVYTEECYCVQWEERQKEDLAIKMAEVLCSKISKEKLALTLSTMIVDKYTDEYDIHVLSSITENREASYLLNWAIV